MMKRDAMAAAQTASINDQDIMTYLPGGNVDSGENGNDQETMEDIASFNASLDALIANEEDEGPEVGAGSSGDKFSPHTALTSSNENTARRNSCTVSGRSSGNANISSISNASRGNGNNSATVVSDTTSLSGWSAGSSLNSGQGQRRYNLGYAYMQDGTQEAPQPQQQPPQQPLFMQVQSTPGQVATAAPTAAGTSGGGGAMPIPNMGFGVGVGQQHMPHSQQGAAQAMSFASQQAPQPSFFQGALPVQQPSVPPAFVTSLTPMALATQSTSSSMAPPPPPQMDKGVRAMETTPPPGNNSGNYPKTRGEKRRDTETGGGTAVSEDEEERRRRRADRNFREQQRAHRISNQIAELRSVLAAANVHFKPDKHSTLVGVSEYIRQLQSRSALLDAEHKKLLETIQRTDELVKANHVPAVPIPDGSTSASVGGNDLLGDLSQQMSSSSSTSSPEDDDLMVFVRGLDYKSIFGQCGIALGIASVDGRFVDCNDEFVRISGYSREELLHSGQAMHLPTSPVPGPAVGASPSPHFGKKSMSLFNLLTREDMEKVFKAMSRMLKNSATARDRTVIEFQTPSSPGGQLKGQNQLQLSPGGTIMFNQHFEDHHVDNWSGVVRQTRRKDMPLRMNISLVRTLDGRPKFFNCALTREDT